MGRPLLAVALLALAGPALLGAASGGSGPRPDPRELSALPTHIRKVEPAIVGIHVQVPRDRPSVLTLGAERSGSGVIFDGANGYALTVSYLLLDAERIEVTLRDGRKAPAKLVGLDLEVGLGVVRLEGRGPWPAAALGDSTRISEGSVTGTVGLSDDGELIATPSRVEAVAPFAAAWEYMLDRAFFVAPHNAAFGGGALVDAGGAVVGITSLRLGEAPFVNLAIPIEKFLPGKDELLSKGRVVSRPPRPWLGLYTVSREGGGVVVAGTAAVGPARAAGFRQGDVIVRINGEPVSSREDFYSRLWSVSLGEEVQVVVQRGGAFVAITVRPADRYRFYRTVDN
ncbi:MAG TPA: S1C family serine protease [Methylomirabilota bacterium]|nr:S1C family serine protease [Methylomirabilota bacterium]